MKRGIVFFACTVGLLSLTLILLFAVAVWGMDPGSTAIVDLVDVRQSPPIILTVAPNEAPNNLDTTITITGSGFHAVLSGTQVLTKPAVSIDEITLSDVGWVSSQTLTGTVPWGLDAGVYTMTVSNPDGQIGAMIQAFTVTQGIGVWTTGGPYGGSVHALAVSPVVSRTAFAYVSDAGLFGTRNGGDSWELKRYDDSGWGVSYGIAPTNTLYFWSASGLWKSDDEGETFRNIAEGIGVVRAFVPDPYNEMKLWIGRYPHDVLYSANGGLNWEVRSAGLPTDSCPAAIAIDPLTPSTLYVALEDGRVFKTTNSGVSWIEGSTGLPSYRPFPPYTLVVNPFSTNVLLFAPAIGPDPAYRSVDAGETWQAVQVDLDNCIISDIAFSPYVSGTAYGALFCADRMLAVSVDAGATWTTMPFSEPAAHPCSIGLDPATGLPIYLGELARGVKRSNDGGQTWELATDGITGMMIQDVVADPTRPERVLVAGEGAGAFVSDNAGQSWQGFDLPYTFADAIALDPQQPSWIYVSPGLYVFRSQDGGATWDSIPLPNHEDVFVETMAVDPLSSNILYAAGRDDVAWAYNLSIGVGFRSKDYGATWQPLTFTMPISAVSQILVHPTEPLTVYIAAGRWTWNLSSGPGKGVFRSRDGGQTWASSTEGMGDVAAFALAIHPGQPRTVYATAWLSSANKVTVFKSTDGGDTWTPTGLRMDYDYRGNPIVIDPIAPETLFAAGQDGLFRSVDGGETWMRAPGSLGEVSVTALSAASAGERTIVYVGTTGGALSGSLDRQSLSSSPLQQTYVRGGIYQQTVVHRPARDVIYLPLVTKN